MNANSQEKDKDKEWLQDIIPIFEGLVNFEGNSSDW